MSLAESDIARSSITAGLLPFDATGVTRTDHFRLAYPMPAGLSLKIINDPEGIDALKAEWDALLESNHTSQLAFQSHAWLRTWLKVFVPEACRTPKSVAIVTARVGGKLRVVAPFAIRQTLGMTQLTWLGEPASQYGDVVTDGTAASRELVVEVMKFAIKQLKPDIVNLRKVRRDAAIMPWLISKNAVPTTPEKAPYLDFRAATSFEEYCKKFSSKSRKNRRRLRRRLQENGAVTTTVLTCGEAARDAIRTGIAFKQQWLIERGHISSALRDKNMSDFLSAVVSQSDRLARPFVSVMHCGATPVSVQFGIISNGRLALHMIAYNPETEKSGAGVLHIEDTIAYCINNNLIELDLLAPNAAYKQDWADAVTPVADYVIARSMHGRIYAGGYLYGTRDMLKNRVETLPLSMRQNIAKRMQK